MKAGSPFILFPTVFIWISQGQTLKLGYVCKELMWEVIQGNIRKTVRDGCSDELPL